MTEDKAVSDIALAWVEALRSRGVSVQARGKNVAYHPRSAYSSLSAEERATVKEHKAAIVAVLMERYGGTAQAVVKGVTDATAAREPQAAPAPPPAPCKRCGRSPCIGESHPAFDALHPIEAQRRADELATEELMLALTLGSGITRW